MHGLWVVSFSFNIFFFNFFNFILNLIFYFFFIFRWLYTLGRYCSYPLLLYFFFICFLSFTNLSLFFFTDFRLWLGCCTDCERFVLFLFFRLNFLINFNFLIYIFFLKSSVRVIRYRQLQVMNFLNLSFICISKFTFFFFLLSLQFGCTGIRQASESEFFFLFLILSFLI